MNEDTNMNSNKINRETVIYILILFYIIPLSIILFVNMFSSLFQTTYTELYLDTERPSYKADSPILLLLLTFVFILILGFYLKKHKVVKETAIVFEKTALIFSVVICFFGIFLFRVAPTTDGASVSRIAADFLNGSYGSFLNNDYLFIYSHQLSMVAYMELVYYIFGAGNYIVLQFLNLIAVFFVIYFLHRITQELFNNYEIQVILSILCIGMLSLYLYVPYIYGDIPGIGFAVPAIYCVMKYLRTRKKLLLLPSFFCIAFSILLKSNNYVILVASIIILILHLIKEKDLFALVFAVVLLLGPVVITSCINTAYAKAADIEEIPDGIPKIGWVAMGLQENDYLENGWFNNYHCTIYEACDFDTAKTKEACMESIKQSLYNFISSPRNGVRFFYQKFVSQWNDPGFQSQLNIEWGSRRTENKSSLAMYFIYGNGRTIMEGIMNIYHFIILLGAVVGVAISYRKTSQSFALIALCVFGGYFFHMFWEAKGRYGLEYFVLCVPMAAYGIWKLAKVMQKLQDIWHKIYTKGGKTLA